MKSVREHPRFLTRASQLALRNRSLRRVNDMEVELHTI
jgi:hypothetical protein